MVGCCRPSYQRPEQEDQHVLHHRRSRRGHRDCKLFGAALITRARKVNVLSSAALKCGKAADDTPFRRPVRMASWWAILVATRRRTGKDNLSALAAGAAFQALLSLFPTLTAVVSLYGLVADPKMVERQITAMQGVLPRKPSSSLPRGCRPLSKARPRGSASASSSAYCSPSGACGRQRGC